MAVEVLCEAEGTTGSVAACPAIQQKGVDFLSVDYLLYLLCEITDICCPAP